MASSAARTARTNPRPKRVGEQFARSHHATRGASSSPSDDGQPFGSGADRAKKARFDVRNPSTLAAASGADDPDVDDEDTAVLALDEIGRGGAQAKRGAVNLDGFDSDSSGGNFDERAAAKARRDKARAQAEAEEELDMFADLEEPDGDADEDDGGKKKKAVRFIDADQIRGQVANSRAGGHVSADFTPDDGPEGQATATDPQGKGKGKATRRSSGSASGSSASGSDSESGSGGDEARAALPADVDAGDLDAAELGAGAKRRHAPRLDAFNMKAEGEEGRFDESGNFVRQAADPDAVHDRWLQGVSKRDMRRARQAAEEREREREERERREGEVPTAEVLRALIPLLEAGETVLEALQRLGRGAAGAGKKKKAKKVPKWQQRKKARREAAAAAMDVDAGEPHDPASHPPDAAAAEADGHEDAEDAEERRRTATVEAITEAADRLLARGRADVYDAERGLLARWYAREAGEAWADRAPSLPSPSSSPPPADAAPGGGAGGGEGGGAGGVAGRWYFRWSDGRDGGGGHGPFGAAEMRAWAAAGYFASGAVEFRRGEGAGWAAEADFG